MSKQIRISFASSRPSPTLVPDNTRSPPQAENQPAKKAAKSFCQSWLQEFKWLEYAEGQMKCKVCREAKKSSPMVSGCTNFRKSTLTRHLESTEHKQATQEKLLRRNFQQSYEQALTTNDEAILTAMKTVYFMVKTLTPTSQYSEHIEFLKFLGMYFWKSNYCSY